MTGLSPEGQCPECGSPIEFALRPDVLKYSNPAYVAKLHTGALLVVLGMVTMILMFLLTMFIGFTGAMTGGMGVGTSVLAPMMGFAAGVLSLVGWWLLSSPDPGKAEFDLGASSRKVLRVLLIIQAAASVFTLVVTLAGISFTAQTLLIVVSGIETLASPAAFIASMLYLRTLAYRMPSQHIADRAKMLLWFAVVIFVVAILMFAGTALAVSAGGGAGIGVVGCLALPMGLMGIVFFVMYLFLLDRTRRTLKEILERM